MRSIGSLSTLRRWGVLAALMVMTYVLPNLFPRSRPLNVLFGGKAFLITWAIIVGMISMWQLVRRYLRARYPQSPPVSRQEYPAISLSVLLLLVMVFIDEYYRVNPVPDFFPLRLYLFLFGFKRYLFTWPILVLLIFKWNRFRQRKKHQEARKVC